MRTQTWPMLFLFIAALPACGGGRNNIPTDGDADADTDADADADGDADLPIECDSVRDFPEPTAQELAAVASAECETHADCTQGHTGRCLFDRWAEELGEDPALICSYDECLTDEDCDAGEVCACDNHHWTRTNECVPAECRDDDDCGEGSRCRAERAYCLTEITGLFCTAEADECDPIDHECPDLDEPPDLWAAGVCVHGDGRWQCGHEDCYD